jgi:PIN domain nuclease of toxin-antitoxin system
VRIILDTHIFLWAVSEPEKINGNRRLELESLANIIYVSSISVAEIMIKASIGKLAVEFNPVEIAVESGFELLDFTANDAVLLKDLPLHHKDPFDRMLITQSISNKYPLMSDDMKLSQYSCRLI